MANTTIKKRKISEKSLANLRPFKKGENGGSHGRPRKEDCLLSCIKEELTKLSPDGVSTNEQMIASVLVAMAARGNIKAVELMMSYLHARPSQGLDLSVKADVQYIIGKGYTDAREKAGGKE